MANLKYDVGTNFDYRLFDVISECDTEKRIKNIYGKLKYDGLPGGRNAAMVPDLTDDQFAEYIAECNKRGLTFNYLINPLCLGQSELDPDVGKNIRDTLHKFYDMGVRFFTINSPSLIKFVKKEFSDVQVTLGLAAYPVTIQQVEYWRTWGVDEITLDHSFNRNFDLLRKLMNNYKNTDFAMRVIANNFCLKECPYRIAHGGFTGHSDPKAVSMDYNLINCTYRKVTMPKTMITAEWIRPEDVHYYEELTQETGYRNFSLKLVDRARATPFIERVIRAYCTEEYKGNLLDILNWPGKKDISRPSLKAEDVAVRPPEARSNTRYAERVDPEFFPKFGRTMHFPDMYIDNQKLDGFIEHFINHNNCANTVCAGSILGSDNKCDYACNYCGLWADKAISFNQEEVESWKRAAEEVMDSLEKGSLYK